MSLGFFQQTVICGNEKFTSGSLGGSDVEGIVTGDGKSLDLRRPDGHRFHHGNVEDIDLILLKDCPFVITALGVTIGHATLRSGAVACLMAAEAARPVRWVRLVSPFAGNPDQSILLKDCPFVIQPPRRTAFRKRRRLAKTGGREIRLGLIPGRTQPRWGWDIRGWDIRGREFPG